jgi:hypothetical protein
MDASWGLSHGVPAGVALGWLIGSWAPQEKRLHVAIPVSFAFGGIGGGLPLPLFVMTIVSSFNGIGPG